MFSQKICPEQIHRSDSGQSTTATQLPHRCLPAAVAAFVLSTLMFSGLAYSQQALNEGTVAPMGEWLEYREARYKGDPLLVHLRTGYERAIVMPEPVTLDTTVPGLPGCEVVVDEDVVGFYPTQTFTRRSIILVGQETGTRYDLRVRASTQGMRQPMRISR